MDFLLKTWGISLTNDTTAKLIYFYIGTGDNCKSTIRKLLAGLCGDFATSLNKDILVRRKRDAGKATTELQSLFKARISFSDELGVNDILVCEKIKELTGETPICFRDLYKNQMRNFNHYCTLMINSNNLPKFDALDIATKNRLCVIPCDKQWRSSPGLDLVDVDCLGNNYYKQLRRDPEQAKLLMEQDGLDALFTMI